MKLRFRSVLATDAYKAHGIIGKENLIVLRHEESDTKRIWKELFKINEKTKASGNDIELDVVVNIYYKPRSLQANKLMWALYNILAFIMNRENKTRDKPYTAQELHDEDMINFAPRRVVFCSEGDESYFREILENERGEITERKVVDGLVYFTLMETTRYWNNKQMSDHIERLFNTLVDMHVTKESDGDVKAVFDDFENWKKKGAKEDEKNNG